MLEEVGGGRGRGRGEETSAPMGVEMPYVETFSLTPPTASAL